MALFLGGCDSTTAENSDKSTLQSSLDPSDLPSELGTPPPSFPEELKDI